MNRKLIVTTAGVFLILLGHQVCAEGGADADDPTMRIMGNAEATLPDAVMKEIMLPEDLLENAAAVANAENGHSVANVRHSRRDAGLTTADDARNQAMEMAEAVQENQETHGRSDEFPDPPERPVTPQPQGGN